MLSAKQKTFVRKMLAEAEAEHARNTSLEPDCRAAWHRLMRYASCQIFRLGSKWHQADTWHLVAWIAERKYRSLRRRHHGRTLQEYP